MFAKLVCCQDFPLLFLTFTKRVLGWNSRPRLREASPSHLPPLPAGRCVFCAPLRACATLSSSFRPRFSSQCQCAQDLEFSNRSNVYVIARMLSMRLPRARGRSQPRPHAPLVVALRV